MHIPRATYRFQFNEHFRLADALPLVPYLHDLGISHVYASPLFLASPHSTHGYDVCDFTRLNPELGTETDLEKLAAALHERQMGLVLDIVPNHMGITSPENLWWWDVLTHGRKSPYAGHFDINWPAGDKTWKGKILLPLLGDHYEAVLKKGELKVLFEKDQLVLGYHEHRFPLEPVTISKISADPVELGKLNSNFAALDKLIRRQNYRLEFHEQGDAKLNYRRFFAVSTLAAVRVEDEAVFQTTHQLIRRWIEAGWVDGLRVDHPDGLHDPGQYLRRLRELAPQAWIVVEKILEPGEQLPESWPVAGTTGYDFLNELNALFVDVSSQKAFTDFYAGFTGETTDYPALVLEKERAVLKTLFATEFNRLLGLFMQATARQQPAGQISPTEWQQALAGVIVCYSVYRTYFTGRKGAASPTDAATLCQAVQRAEKESKNIPREAWASIQNIFLKHGRGKTAVEFVARFQQLTGAVMAKGVEDTAFYCFNRFVSLNEVGGDPQHFGGGPETFHAAMQQRHKTWPHSQLTTSTHDTKRAEDVRARLNVLSEIPELWQQTVRRWSAMNECHRQNNFPDRNAEYLFYQTVAGAWPLSYDRAQFYMEKAAHESKQHTTWTQRNTAYEKALQSFDSETLRDPQFTADVDRFVRTLADAAAVNSLAQTLIKLTAPGVPDIYQGCELWDWSLVDPDNRRPVDFRLRAQLLAEVRSVGAESAWARRAEGLPKLWLIQRTLKLRKGHPDFFNYDYEPLFAQGARAGHLTAFVRSGKMITMVPRFWLKLNQQWQDTTVELPTGVWRDEFTGEIYTGRISAADFFNKFPAALLVKQEN